MQAQMPSAEMEGEDGQRYKSVSAPQMPDRMKKAMMRERFGTKGDLSYNHEMKCTHLELKAGDRLYIPMGVYHGAVTGPDGSAHIDYGFGRVGILWLDLVNTMLAASSSVGGRVSELLRKSVVGPDILTPESVALAHPIPMWLLKRGGQQRNSKPEMTEHIAEAAIFMFPYFQEVIVPALKKQLAALLSDGFDDAIDTIIGAVNELKAFAVGLQATKPTVDKRIIRGNEECARK